MWSNVETLPEISGGEAIGNDLAGQSGAKHAMTD
jgi:hypothetical protein